MDEQFSGYGIRFLDGSERGPFATVEEAQAAIDAIMAADSSLETDDWSVVELWS